MIRMRRRSRVLADRQRRLEAMLRAKEGRCRALEDRLVTLTRAVDQSPASVFVTDPVGRILYVNAKFVEGTGYSEQELLGRTPRILNSGLNPSGTFARLWRTVLAGEEWRGELINRKKSGELYWDEISISPVRGADGRITHFVAVQEDITRRKEYEARLIRQANFDDLTGLPNRQLALDRLGQAIVRTRRLNLKAALLFLDLDRLKQINDTFGHPEGDRVLRQAADRLRHCVREGDTVARLGGDEFMVILSDLHAPTDAELVAKKLLDAFSRPFETGFGEVFATVSIGIAIAPDDADDAEVLLRNADAALYRVKERGRNAFQFFTREMNARTQRRLLVETHLRRALERGQLDLHYQPIADARSGAIVGVEALMRWQNDELGVVEPAEFIPLAEETGQIVPMGAWALTIACRRAAEWQRDELGLTRLTVNVSARQFRGGDLPAAVADALAISGLAPSSLEVEITESVFVEGLSEIEEQLRTLEAQGVRISVDDFGTGYASLSYLRRFPVKTVKIDKSFVHDVIFVPGNARVVEAIIALGHSLNLDVVGEGIESLEELQFLRANGCDLVQGYYVGEPMPGDAIAAFLHDRRSESRSAR